MFNKKSLRSSVMKVINKRIEDEQKAFDSEVKELDNKLDLDIKSLKSVCEKAKVDVETKHVDNIIGKLI